METAYYHAEGLTCVSLVCNMDSENPFAVSPCANGYIAPSHSSGMDLHATLDMGGAAILGESSQSALSYLSEEEANLWQEGFNIIDSFHDQCIDMPDASSSEAADEPSENAAPTTPPAPASPVLPVAAAEQAEAAQPAPIASSNVEVNNGCEQLFSPAGSLFDDHVKELSENAPPLSIPAPAAEVVLPQHAKQKQQVKPQASYKFAAQPAQPAGRASPLPMPQLQYELATQCRKILMPSLASSLRTSLGTAIVLDDDTPITPITQNSPRDRLREKIFNHGAVRHTRRPQDAHAHSTRARRRQAPSTPSSARPGFISSLTEAVLAVNEKKMKAYLSL